MIIKFTLSSTLLFGLHPQPTMIRLRRNAVKAGIRHTGPPAGAGINTTMVVQKHNGFLLQGELSKEDRWSKKMTEEALEQH